MDVSNARIALVSRINRLEFAEYSAVGWLKVAPLDELLRYAVSADKEVVNRYSADPHNPGGDSSRFAAW